MAKIAYMQFAFRPDTLRMIDICNGIITDYQAQGFDLTLRQLYYQCVSRDLIRNDDKEYRKLGSIVNDARLAGLIDWDAITDRTRNVRTNPHWGSPAEIIRSAATGYRLDTWVGQRCMIEVWIEKDALIGVIEGTCTDLDVPYFSCRGYTSQSEMWQASQRLLRYVRRGMTPIVLHLGDHDPSGIDMSRDIRDRLSLFVGDTVDVRRIALTMDQVYQYNPPPNPAKLTDSRGSDYVARYGDESWELDALEPTVLAALIRVNTTAARNEATWQRQYDRQEAHRATLQRAADRWADVVAFMTDEEDDA